MKRLLFFILFLISPVIVSGQVIDLEINGVDVGTSYETVIRQLGKPQSQKKAGTNPCGNTKLTLRYPGLVIALDRDDKEQNFIVVSIDVTSPKWSVASGVNVGASLKDVQAKFVKTKEPTKEAGFENLSYFVTDGYADFYFRNKKLAKVVWFLNLC